MNEQMIPGLRGAILATWLALSFAFGHPLADTGRDLFDPPASTRLDDFLARVDSELPGDAELALWWPDRDAEGLATLAHWWATAGYRLAPRRVYPLLTENEARSIEPLLEGLRPFLAERGAAMARGELEVAVAVAVWGDGCRLAEFPDLRPVLQDGLGCLLRPSSQVREATPP